MTTSVTNLLTSIAVLSDIHAFASSDRSAESAVDYIAGSRARNPLVELVESARDLGIRADTLVCAGDICNKADPTGLERAWADLHRLVAVIEAESLVPTCGNHDLDSRFLFNESDPDPKGAALSLVPSFPFASANLTDKYWARNYAILSLPSGVVMVVLNTSAYHGGKQEEIDHGRVCKRTINAIADELAVGYQGAAAYVLVCHHHPMPLSAKSASDMEYVRDGQPLLDVLTQTTRSSWLVVHGHRHHPKLMSGATPSNYVPFIFGAGSLGARTPGVTNQFHLISLFQSNDSEFSSVNGIVETWSWSDSTGWGLSSSSPSSGLPGRCGFGFRGQIPALAAKIAGVVGATFARIHDVRTNCPAIDFLTPDSLRDLIQELRAIGYQVLYDDKQQICQVGK